MDYQFRVTPVTVTRLSNDHQ